MLNPSAKKDLEVVAAVKGLDAAALNDLASRTSVWKQVEAKRKSFLRDPWYMPGVRGYLESQSRKKAPMMATATAIAFASRSAVAHGHWARVADDQRPVARLAEDWLWTLVQRGVELQLLGRQAPSIKAIGRSSVTV